MDAHLFSRFCEELAPRIIGGWLEKVQEPAPGLLAFNINLAARGQSYGQAGGSRKCQLCLRAARKEKESAKPPKSARELYRLIHALELPPIALEADDGAQDASEQA